MHTIVLFTVRISCTFKQKLKNYVLVRETGCPKFVRFTSILWRSTTTHAYYARINLSTFYNVDIRCALSQSVQSSVIGTFFFLEIIRVQKLQFNFLFAEIFEQFNIRPTPVYPVNRAGVLLTGLVNTQYTRNFGRLPVARTEDKSKRGCFTV